MTEWNPSDLARGFYEHGKDWSEKDGAASLYEETRRTLRAQIALKFLPDAGSVSKAEMNAEGTIEYIEHVKAMVAARTVANIARAQFDADRAFIDLVRSQESSRRAEMQLGGR
jgi:hypothetical protein